MKHIKLISVLLAIISLVSCQKKLTSEEVNEQMASGVVLIWNSFYYSVSVPGMADIYFNSVDDKGQLQGLTYDEDEARENATAICGTGFFVSKSGEIMTNRHVAQPGVSEQIVKVFLKNYKRMLKSGCQEKLNEAEKQFYQYEGNAYAQNQIVQQYKEYSELFEQIDDLDMNDAEFNTHSDIKINYNNTQVVKDEDFFPCSIIAVSDEDNLDLALIQLDEGVTPEDKHVFQLRDNDEELTLDEKLFMIGFNRGYTLANTEQGIRAQVYTGNVTQKSDGVEILYSIPSQGGSSGSPVIDEQGFLVAVHFAGISGTQSFNYGIPAKRVRQFLRDN